MWICPRSLTVLTASTISLGLTGRASAQQEEEPSPEKIEARRVAAENAPLFASNDPLVLTLRTDIKLLRDKRPAEDEVDGTVTFPGPDGDTMTVPVKVRTRGNFRRSKSNCNFPPLRLNFAGKSVGGTVFEGQDKLKLVSPCQDSKDDYQQYVLQEYLVYRLYQMLTPVSFRVRLVRITYEDVNGKYDTRTKTGFLIETDKAMAERNSGQLWEWERFSPTDSTDSRAAVRVLARADPNEAEMMWLFEFMVGNTDFSAPFMHNVVMVRTAQQHYIWVPYDFDWSGVVNARYAVPDPKVGVRSVRDRAFRGFCLPRVDLPSAVSRLKAIRDSIAPLYQGVQGLEDKQRKQALEYYDKFYEILNEPRQFERQVVKACMQIS